MVAECCAPRVLVALLAHAPSAHVCAATVWIVLLLGAFVTGVVVDAFSARRDKAEIAAQDQADVCFICGRHRASFRTSASTFEDHVTNRHYMCVHHTSLALTLWRRYPHTTGRALAMLATGGRGSTTACISWKSTATSSG